MAKDPQQREAAETGNAVTMGAHSGPRMNLRQRITEFLKWIKPYKEITALGTAAVIAVSGVVAWAVSYFATRAQLSSLECRITADIAQKIMTVQTDSFTNQIDWRQAQLKQLAQQRQPSDLAVATMIQLQNDVGDLTGKQTALAKQFANAVPELLKKCNSGDK